MKKILFVCVFIGCLNPTLRAQINWEHYSVGGGVNLFTPTLISRNQNNLKSLNPSWQFGLNGDFKISPSGKVRVTLGFTDNAFTAEKEFRYTGRTSSVEKLHIGYAHIEVDYIYSKRLNNYTLFGGLGLRSSLICYENYSSMYYFTGLSSSAFGGNGILGIQFPNTPRKPSLQLNYYYSFTHAAYNSVRDIQGNVFNDRLKNRAIGFQVFFNLKK